jgi:hypothetical protein
MDSETKLKIIDVILAIAMIILVVVAIPFVMAYFEEQPENVEDIVNSCLNMSLEDSSKCVLDITKGFYKYNIDNVSRDLTFNELKEEGGVCSSWSDYYSEIGSQLGFKTKNVIIPTSQSENIYHEFSVWSSKEGYCVLDQTELMCVDLQ